MGIDTKELQTKVLPIKKNYREKGRPVTPIKALDEIIIPASIESVWESVADVASYADWWPKSIRVRVLQVETDGIGSCLELHPVGGRAFRCRIEAIARPSQMTMQYFGGFISGQGEWRLQSVDGGTKVQYHLDVQAAGRLVAWIGRLVPLGKIHSYQMQGVLRRLSVKVLAR